MTSFILIVSTAAIAFFFLWNRSRKQATALTTEIQKIRADLEHYRPILDVEAEAQKRRKELEEKLAKINQDLGSRQSELNQITVQVHAATNELATFEVRLEEHHQGLYEAKYEFEDIAQYAEALDLIREAQRELLRAKETVKFDGLKSNQTQYRDIARLAVSAFNGEFLSIVEGVTHSNFDKCRESLNNVFEKINKQISKTGYQISNKLLTLKQKELALVNDYKMAEQKIKDEQAELKAAMREEEKARVEAERAREKAIKEQERYQAALEQARNEMESKSAEERVKHEKEILELQRKLEEAKAERERATSMAQITKTGHVYIISNIGSFGEHVFKIGMTRRKEPEDRVRELSDASVPFGYDIHAMVYTTDAPTLENSLHRHFEEKRVNKVNQRKEFFNVTIDDIQSACEKLGYNVKLSKLAEAREYRETIRIRETKKSA